MKIYLAGKIPKGKELDTYKDWRQDYREILLQEFPNMEFFDPDNTEANDVMPETDVVFWCGHDSWMIRESDAIIVQADRKLGVGTSQEMIIAKFFNKPVITVLPKDTHHRKTDITMRSGFVADWIHPFIDHSSDLVIEKLEDAVTWIKEYEADKSSKQIKTMAIIGESIDYYLKKMEEHKHTPPKMKI